MKRTLGAILAVSLFLTVPVWAKHKESTKEGTSSKGKSHKTAKGKKGKGSKGSKGDNSGANMESEIKPSDLQFNSKGSK